MAQGNPIATIEALFFDVFGTLVDWRTSIACVAERVLSPLGHRLDWLAFADAWAGRVPARHGRRADRAHSLQQARRAAPA
jgi:FMN phosphatase YigB (HAD superfamily)